MIGQVKVLKFFMMKFLRLTLHLIGNFTRKLFCSHVLFDKSWYSVNNSEWLGVTFFCSTFCNSKSYQEKNILTFSQIIRTYLFHICFILKTSLRICILYHTNVIVIKPTSSHAPVFLVSSYLFPISKTYLKLPLITVIFVLKVPFFSFLRTTFLSS